ncbi:hypothetical protein EMIHUDRAFT_58503, partial [Emiliania huxleyi CCMP1516]|uniref:EF-hand domain-containing protein n=2 Tax=Emiliania huxleyi TaxID=2903 RepID=A0A0D3IU71_EMIH1
EARRAFERFDGNRTGKLSGKELREALDSMKLDSTSHDGAALLRKFDADGSGTLSLSEFQQLCQQLEQAAVVVSPEVRRAFERYDHNGSGALDRSELEAALRDMGLDMTSKEAGVALRSVDVDGNGRLDLQEFARL